MKNSFDTNRLSRRSALLGGLSGLVVLGTAPRLFAAPETINIVATTGMIADVTARVGGEHVTVRGLMGSGIDPHGYRQTRSDIVAMTRADLVLWHGLYLEAQMESFFEDLSRQRKVVPVAEALPKDVLLTHPTYDGRYDPHVWMDPSMWSEVVREIARALSDVMPAQADAFAANATAYQAELAKLTDYGKTALTAVPEEKRVLVTAHDAFSYFGRAFGFEVLGIQGISTASEAGLNRISGLVDELVARNIGAVFVETSVSDRNMRALIEGAGAQGHDVRIGGSLFSDAMGVPGTYEGTYIGMIDHNVTTVATALGADIAAGGMVGKLAQGS